jgi:hypothetical protein
MDYFWTQEKLSELYELKVVKEKNYSQIAKKIGNSADACRRKFNRVDWDLFISSPQEYMAMLYCPQKWSRDEMLQLHAFVQSERSPDFISKKMKRSVNSVESKIRDTDWESWVKAMSEVAPSVSVDSEENKDRLVQALLLISRHDAKRLGELSESDFLRKINLEPKDLTVPYEDIKKEVLSELRGMGLTNPSNIELKEGKYIIVGDSHGKKTKQKMFDLLKIASDTIGVSNVIHIGHILDDDNDMNYNWGAFDNLIILSKKEELRIIESKKKSNWGYSNSRVSQSKVDTTIVVRDYISLGNGIVIMNQDFISDYVKTPIRSLEQELLDESAIVSCHRQEFFTKCSDEMSHIYYASPGCICEPHVIKTIRQIDFTEGKEIKVAYHDGFQKYRKMEQLMKLWNQGFLVANVDAFGNVTIIPCAIETIMGGKTYATSYFDKIITNNGVENPDKKIFITGDAHCPLHDINILDIQEQICKDYGADILVNLGDTHNFGSLNHHEMERGKKITDDILKESAYGYHVLKLMREWAKECHILYGNHERFAKDFTDKFPQLSSLLDFQFLCGVEGLGYKVTDLKEVLRIGPCKFIHGDMKMYNQGGSMLEKASRTFGKYTFVGHIHRPEKRFNAISVGFSGKLDQGYNEPSASSWMHGFGMCNIYKGVQFPTVIAIGDNSCSVGGKKYSPQNPKKWVMNSYKTTLSYETS